MKTKRYSHASAWMLAVVLVNSRPAAASWPSDPTTNLAVTKATGSQATPTLATDGAGGAIIVWEDDRPLDGGVYAQHVLANGALDPSWPANGAALCTAGVGQHNPMIISDGACGAIVTWWNQSGEFWGVYAQHVLSNGAPDPSWPACGRVLRFALGVRQSPSIVVDGAGGAIVVWEDAPWSANGDIFAQHVLANGVVDPAWPVDGAGVSIAVGDQNTSRSVSDGAGGVIVSWDDRGHGWSIRAQHLLAGGGTDPSWSSDGVVLTEGDVFRLEPTIAGDGAGGAIVTWQDARSDSGWDIYAQHVMRNGEVDPAWPRGGSALCTASERQYYPTILADGAGGAIVAWWDYRSGFPNSDIYAQHVLATGEIDPKWPVNGVVMCTAPGEQVKPSIVADGIGGAILTWEDYRSGTYPNGGLIYSQHVLAAGIIDPAWPAGAVAVCTAAGNRAYVSTILDGAGGAIATWQDERYGELDVYAQRILATGQLGGDATNACLHVVFEFRQRHLNWKSKIEFVTAFISPPAPYLASQIDVASIRLNQVVRASAVAVADHDHVLKVKFSRELVKATLPASNLAPVSITGSLAGTCFVGGDTITVRVPRMHRPAAGERLVAGGRMTVGWDPVSESHVRSVTLLSSADNGNTWRVAAEGLANTGSYVWLVPSDATDQARLAVGLVYDTDGSGGIPESVIAESDQFAIVTPTAVEISRFQLSLHAVNPAVGQCTVTFSLPNRSPASLTVFDVGGREVGSARDVGSDGPGWQTSKLGALPAGIYLVRLSQNGRSVSARVAVMR